ncbi:hypothetical protein [Natronorubrum halophilum]|nr:hypothetical protein [Natronorubrum halophilum]
MTPIKRHNERRTLEFPTRASSVGSVLSPNQFDGGQNALERGY